MFFFPFPSSLPFYYCTISLSLFKNENKYNSSTFLLLLRRRHRLSSFHRHLFIRLITWSLRRHCDLFVNNRYSDYFSSLEPNVRRWGMVLSTHLPYFFNRSMDRVAVCCNVMLIWYFHAILIYVCGNALIKRLSHTCCIPLVTTFPCNSLRRSDFVCNLFNNRSNFCIDRFLMVIN